MKKLTRHPSFYFFFLLFFSITSSATGQTEICNPPFSNVGNTPYGCRFCGEELIISNQGFTEFSSGIDFPCGIIDNNFFLILLPDSTGTLEVEILASNCQTGGGIQAVLFDRSFNALSNCSSSTDPDDPGILRITNIPPDQEIVFMADGFAGDVCDLKMTVLQGTDRAENPRALDPIQVTSPNQTDPNLVCNSTAIQFAVNALPEITDYIWEVDQHAAFTPDPKDSTLTVRFHNPGISKVSVTPYNVCQQGTTVEVELDVKESPESTFPTQPVCLTLLPIEIDGNIFDEIGTFEVPYPYLTCDSIVTYTLTQRPQIFLTEDMAVCDEYPPVYNREVYDSAGNFQIILPHANPNLCDTSLDLTLRFPTRVAPEIYCLTDSFLNALAIRWDAIELAEDYELFINGNLETRQNHASFLFFPNAPGEDLDIKVQPSNALQCRFPEGKKTCKAPEIVSNQATDQISQISVFPNPSKGVFEIYAQLPLQEIEVLDFSGKTILKNTNFKNEKIDLSRKPVGVYFFKVKSEEFVFIKKVLKN